MQQKYSNLKRNKDSVIVSIVNTVKFFSDNQTKFSWNAHLQPVLGFIGVRTHYPGLYTFWHKTKAYSGNRNNCLDIGIDDGILNSEQKNCKTFIS